MRGPIFQRSFFLRQQKTPLYINYSYYYDNPPPAKPTAIAMLPLYLLTSAKNQQILVELKNGETINGNLVNCDSWMNLTLNDVIQTFNNGEEFNKLSEVYIKGIHIKYLRLPELVMDKAKEQNALNLEQKHRNNQRRRVGDNYNNNNNRNGHYNNRRGPHRGNNNNNGSNSGNNNSNRRYNNGSGQYNNRNSQPQAQPQ